MREVAFDILKFFFMVEVVTFHLRGNGVVAPAGNIRGIGDNVWLGVAMPSFFIISGYFAHRKITDCDLTKSLVRSFRLQWPLASFGVVFGVLLFAVWGGPWWKMLTLPFARVLGGDWFLRCMAVIYFSVAMIWCIGKSVRGRVVLLLFWLMFLVFVPKKGLPLPLPWFVGWASNVLQMLPYFLFGMLVLKPWQLHRKSLVSIGCGVFFVFVILCEGNARDGGMNFYAASMRWQDLLLCPENLFKFVARTLVGITGTVFFLWIIDCAIALFPKVGRLACFGTTTLGVFVMHGWLFYQIGQSMEDPLPAWMMWPLGIISFFVFHYVVVKINSCPKMNAFFFGDEKWLVEKLTFVMSKFKLGFATGKPKSPTTIRQ